MAQAGAEDICEYPLWLSRAVTAVLRGGGVEERSLDDLKRHIRGHCALQQVRSCVLGEMRQGQRDLAAAFTMESYWSAWEFTKPIDARACVLGKHAKRHLTISHLQHQRLDLMMQQQQQLEVELTYLCLRNVISSISHRLRSRYSQEQWRLMLPCSKAGRLHGQLLRLTTKQSRQHQGEGVDARTVTHRQGHAPDPALRGEDKGGSWTTVHLEWCTWHSAALLANFTHSQGKHVKRSLTTASLAFKNSVASSSRRRPEWESSFVARKSLRQSPLCQQHMPCLVLSTHLIDALTTHVNNSACCDLSHTALRALAIVRLSVHCLTDSCAMTAQIPCLFSVAFAGPRNKVRSPLFYSTVVLRQLPSVTYQCVQRRQVLPPVCRANLHCISSLSHSCEIPLHTESSHISAGSIHHVM